MGGLDNPLQTMLLLLLVVVVVIVVVVHIHLLFLYLFIYLVFFQYVDLFGQMGILLLGFQPWDVTS